MKINFNSVNNPIFQRESVFQKLSMPGKLPGQQESVKQVVDMLNQRGQATTNKAGPQIVRVVATDHDDVEAQSKENTAASPGVPKDLSDIMRGFASLASQGRNDLEFVSPSCIPAGGMSVSEAIAWAIGWKITFEDGSSRPESGPSSSPGGLPEVTNIISIELSQDTLNELRENGFALEADYKALERRFEFLSHNYSREDAGEVIDYFASVYAVLRQRILLILVRLDQKV